MYPIIPVSTFKYSFFKLFDKNYGKKFYEYLKFSLRFLDKSPPFYLFTWNQSDIN